MTKYLIATLQCDACKIYFEVAYVFFPVDDFYDLATKSCCPLCGAFHRGQFCLSMKEVFVSEGVMLVVNER